MKCYGRINDNINVNIIVSGNTIRAYIDSAADATEINFNIL